MKKLIIGLAVGLLLAVFVMPVSGQRGDLYGARALLALEQAFKASGVLTFPNYAVAPVACNAANRGVYYYDTATGQALVCGAAGWISAGLTVGTANTIVKFNAGATDLADSLLLDADVPAAGASGDIITFAATLNIMNGADTTRGLFINILNAAHTGAANSNNFYGLAIDGIVGDASAAEYAIRVETGWDGDLFGATDLRLVGENIMYLYSDGALTVTIDGPPAAGASGDALTVRSPLNIMDGADTFRSVFIDVTSADHVGGPDTNWLYGIEFDDIVNDDDTVEYAVVFDSGWDANLWNISGDLYLGSSTQIVSVLDDTLGQVWSFDSAQAAGASNDYETIVANVAIMDGVGVDVTRGIFLDMSNSDHTDAGAGNFLYGLDIDEIVGDAEATEVAINIQDDWDAAIAITDGNVTTDAICLGDDGCATDAAFFFNAGTLTLDIDATAANAFLLYAGATGLISIQNVATGNNVVVDIYNAANTGFDMFYIDGNSIAATNGSDIVNMLHLDWNETDWATATEVLNGIRIDTIVQDAAEGTYNAINLGDGWNYAITIPDGGAADNSISLGDVPGADVDIYWDGTDLVLDMDATAAQGLDVQLNVTGVVQFTPSAGGVGTLVYDPYNLTDAGVDILTVDVNSIAATNGADIINMLMLRWDETDWATDTETLNGLNIEAITQDAQGLYYAVHVGAVWDAAIYSEGVAQAALAAVANGSIVFCTDCDPASTPCAAAGAQTGAFAFRVNGAWDCPW